MSDSNRPIKFITEPAREAPRRTDTVGSSAAASAGGRTGYSLLNDALAVYVAITAVLAAVPVALNRPILWLGWLALTSVVALLYFGIGYWRDPNRRLLSSKHPWLFGLAMIIPVYALIQSVPLLGGLTAGPPLPDNLQPNQISLVPEASQMAALRFTGYILFALLVIEAAGRVDRARRIAWWVFWGIVGHAIWALVALNLLGDITVWGEEKTAYLGSATGTFVNRNSFATFLAMGAVLGLALLFEQIDKPAMRKARSRAMLGREGLDQLIVWVGLGLIFIALLSTQSRMGVFAGSVGLVTCTLAMRGKAGHTIWRTALWLVAIMVAAVLGGLALYGQDLVWRFVFATQNAIGRGEGYAFIATLIADRPLLGYGFDAFRPTFELVRRPPMDTGGVWFRAHSTYLSHWTELGLIIGSIPIVLAGLVAKRLWDTVRRRERDYAIGVAGLSVLVVVGLHSIVDFSLEMPAIVILMLTILGLGLAHRRGARPRTEPGDTQA